MIFGLVAAIAALGGTAMQGWQALVDIARTDDAVSGLAVQDLRDEVPRWRVRLRREHRRLVKQLLDESPAEREAWLRLRRVLVGWGLMSVAAFYVVIDQTIALF